VCSSNGIVRRLHEQHRGLPKISSAGGNLNNCSRRHSRDDIDIDDDDGCDDDGGETVTRHNPAVSNGRSRNLGYVENIL